MPKQRYKLKVLYWNFSR